MQFLVFLSSLVALIQGATASTTCDNFIVTTKVTPSYWRATFSCPPLNIQGLTFFHDYYALIDQIEADSDVKVVVFDSSAPDFWLDHFDVLNVVPPELSWDYYWGNVTRLANLPVLTVAAIRGITSGGGAEIAASLDIRFGSKEKAIIGQPEVSIGEFQHGNASIHFTETPRPELMNANFRLGVVPGGGGLNLLPRLIGRARALEVIIGADNMDAETAAHYGCKSASTYTLFNVRLHVHPISKTIEQGSTGQYLTHISRNSSINLPVASLVGIMRALRPQRRSSTSSPLFRQ